MSRIKNEWYWLIHHEVLLEALSEPIENRRDFVRRFKEKHEVPTRLKWMVPVKGKIPKKLDDAVRAARIATRKWEAAKKKFGFEAAFIEHRDTLNAATQLVESTYREYMPEIIAMHKAECPGCPFDYENNTLRFPKAGAYASMGGIPQ